MNTKQFSDRIGNIDDRLVHQAENIPNYSRRRPAHRVLTGVLVAAAVLVCTMMAAFAASPELRQAIISLFRIEEVEHPVSPTESDPVASIIIGDEVLAQYVYNCDGMWPEGELLVGRAGEGFTPESNARVFYTLDGDNHLTQIGQDAAEEYVETQWDGLPVVAHFSWFVYHDRLYINDILNTVEEPPYGTYRLFAAGMPGRTDQVILYYNDLEGNYFWIYDLNRGELTDVLAGCGFEGIGRIQNNPWEAMSGSLRYALLELAPEGSDSGLPYLADLEQKTCIPLSELMDLEIPAQEFLEIPTPVRHQVQFMDADHIQLSIARDAQEADQGPVSYWVYHIPSGTVTQTVDQERFAGGAWPLWLTEDESGMLWVVDVRTGVRTQIEEFPLTGNIQYGCNEAGTRMLCLEWDETGALRIGVLDLENGIFRILQRELLEDQYASNAAPDWLGDDRAVSGYVKLDGEFYLCVYQF